MPALAEATGMPVSYWADDEVQPVDFGEPGSADLPAARVRAHVQRGLPLPRRGAPGTVVPDADDPRALEVSGQGLPFPGVQKLAVVYDAARPGRVKDGDLVVVEAEGELSVGWRHTAGRHRSYQSLDAGRPPALLPVERVAGEWPVVAVVLRSRREHARLAEEAESEYRVAEDETPYGRKGRRKTRTVPGTGRPRSGRP